MKQLKEKRNEHVNYQIYAAMEIFKVKKSYLYIVEANSSFDIESLSIESILTYNREYFFATSCMRFVRRYCDLMLNPLILTNFQRTLTSIESRKIRKQLLEHTQEMLRQSKDIYTLQDLNDRRVPLDKSKATCFKNYRKKRIPYLFKRN